MDNAFATAAGASSSSSGYESTDHERNKDDDAMQQRHGQRHRLKRDVKLPTRKRRAFCLWPAALVYAVSVALLVRAVQSQDDSFEVLQQQAALRRPTSSEEAEEEAHALRDIGSGQQQQLQHSSLTSRSVDGLARLSHNRINTNAISEVLDRLTNKSTYDKRLRPRYGDRPVDVGVTIHVSSISAVSEVDMDFTLDFYMRQTWQDPRLAFGDFDLGLSDQVKSLTVGVDYLDRLWKPDTFFPNEKKSFFHTATTHNSFLRIERDGTVYTSQRLTVTATCPMRLQLFPMDSQRCKLEIESYGYTTADIDYFWGKKRGEAREKAVAFSEFMLPQFLQTGYNVNITKAETSSGVYVRLYFEVNLDRNMGFYSMNIVIPSMLIVTISWVSFWLNREASPARVGLGVTTVLTMTTLITTVNNSMPKVSYIKGLDVFLNFCFVMVFASLVEYAIVSYLNKRLALRREKKRKAMENGPPPMLPFAPPPPPKPASPVPQPKNNNCYEMSVMISHQNTPAKGPELLEKKAEMVEMMGYTTSSMQRLNELECDCRTIPQAQNPRLVLTQSAWPSPFGRSRPPKKGFRNVTPAKIDKCSRYMFPFAFFFFNLGYWCVMQLLKSNINLDGKEWFPIKEAD